MRPLGRVALIGNALPRRCGIATFTTDLQQAMANARPDLTMGVVAMNDPGQVSLSDPIKCGVRKEANKWIGQNME